MKSLPLVSLLVLLSASVGSAEPINGFSLAPDASCRLEWDGITGRVFFVQTSTNLCSGWGKAYGARGAAEMGYDHPSSTCDATFFCVTSRAERASEFEVSVPQDFRNITVGNIGYSAYVESLLAHIVPEERDYCLAHMADFGIVSNGLDIAVFSGAETGGQAGQPALPGLEFGVLLLPNVSSYTPIGTIQLAVRSCFIHFSISGKACISRSSRTCARFSPSTG